jgi:hypothetical protein
VFGHILSVIGMQSRQIEQSPSTYVGMGEEDRRQTIVATLNTHYEGRAHAEAFNNEGKTDILIRHDGRNLFICECKFWNGPEGFTHTIDQLFHYTGWRDTKLAIVMFVREKGLTAGEGNASGAPAVCGLEGRCRRDRAQGSDALAGGWRASGRSQRLLRPRTAAEELTPSPSELLRCLGTPMRGSRAIEI